jgi:archaellum component FlaC
MTNKANKKTKYFDKNPIEAALRDAVDDVVTTVKDDILEESVTSAWSQLLGGKSKDSGENAGSEEMAMSGDLTDGQEIELVKKQKQVEKQVARLTNIEAGYDYKNEILHFEQKESRENQNQTSSRIQEVLIEIKQLSKSVKELEIEVKDVSMDVVPVNAGKYHESFFDYLLTVIRNAKIRVENSANWLNVLSGKKDKKGYWNLAKKHGTSYSLSADRVVAQQVG